MSELNEQLRSDFEQEMLRLDIIDDEGLDRDERGEYTDEPAQAAWKAWNAARAAPAPQAAPSEVKDLWVHEDMARDETDAVTSLPRKQLVAAYREARDDLALWKRRALEAEATQTAPSEPVAYVRRHPDGTLTNELLPADRIEPARKASGAWLPLGLIAPLAAQRSPADARDAALEEAAKICEELAPDRYYLTDEALGRRNALYEASEKIRAAIAAATTSTEGR